MSKNINLETPNLEEAVQFYNEVLGSRIAKMDKNWARFDAWEVNLFTTEGKSLGPITEFIVGALDKARNELIEKGCMVVTWKGKTLLHEGPIRVRV